MFKKHNRIPEFSVLNTPSSLCIEKKGNTNAPEVQERNM